MTNAKMIAEEIYAVLDSHCDPGIYLKSWAAIDLITPIIKAAIKLAQEQTLDNECECSGEAHNSTCPWYMNRKIKKAYAKGFADAREKATKECESQELIHHKYSDSYEEGLRDMADLLAQAISALTPDGEAK